MSYSSIIYLLKATTRSVSSHLSKLGGVQWKRHLNNGGQWRWEDACTDLLGGGNYINKPSYLIRIFNILQCWNTEITCTLCIHSLQWTKPFLIKYLIWGTSFLSQCLPLLKNVTFEKFLHNFLSFGY